MNTSATAFNETLTKLRDLYRYRDETSVRSFIWDSIVEQMGTADQLKHGLITYEELDPDGCELDGCGEGGVSAEEAAAFRRPLALPSMPTPALPQTMEQDDEEDPNLDDLV